MSGGQRWGMQAVRVGGCRWSEPRGAEGQRSVKGGRVTHRTPDGDTVFLGVAEVVGLKRVPVGEDDRRVVRPLEVHLHVGVMQANPELLDVWKEAGVGQERG